MCGIVGLVSKKALQEEHLRLSTSVLNHRGPDASSIYMSESRTAGMGHTRLSILDLSESANQPFHSSDGRFVIVFNGEIYNFKELKEELRNSQRVAFTTTGDTEIVLEGFAKWGKDVVHKLNGMFAFAIYDTIEAKLFMARDGMGIKPLYYYHEDNCFAFASEIKSLKELQEIRSQLTIDQNAIADFLHLGYIPSPGTIYNEIKKFPQGHFAEIDQNLKANFQRWWDLDELVQPETHSNKLSATNRLEKLLENSVRSRLVADVTVGSFLSGGTDSSLVSSIANRFSISL